METEFYKKEYSNQEIIPTKLHHVIFEECSFSNIDFKNYDLTGTKFIDCKFNSCDLSNLNGKNSRFLSSEFKNSKLIGIDWSQMEDLINPSFESCLMSFSNFSGLKLKKTKMRDCILHDSDFLQADFSESDFQNSDFLNARFEETVLIKCNFVRAINYQISPLTNRLRSAKFSLSEAIGLLTGFDIIIE